jgi:hypothetical protein
MAFTEKRLGSTPLALSANTETTVYTCPTAQTTTTLVKQIVMTNTGASATVFWISLVPTGSSASTSNRLFNSVAIAANETIILDVSQVMTSGDFLSAKATAAGVNITVSGVENAGGMVISGLADNAVITAKIADSNVTAAKLGPDAFIANNQAGAIVLMEMM